MQNYTMKKFQFASFAVHLFIFLNGAVFAKVTEDCFDLDGLLKDIRKFSDKAVTLIKGKCKDENPTYDEDKIQQCVYEMVTKNLEECENENHNNRKEYADCFYNKLNIKGLKRLPFADFKRIIMKYIKDKNKTKIISHVIDECKEIPQGLFLCTIKKLAKRACPELKRTFFYASTSEEAED